MAMSPDFNNYNPMSGFNPQTALADVRNQIMSAYGQMNQGGANIQPAQNPFMGAISNAMGGVQQGGMNTYGGAPMVGSMAPGSAAGWAQPPVAGGQFGGQPSWGGQPGGGQSYGGQPMGGFQPPMGGGFPPQMGGQPPMGGGGIAGYGLPVGQGAPGGDALAWLQSLGMPIPDFLSRIQAGMPVGPADYNQVVRGLGGMQGLPSPQTLGNLNDSELQFLQGFFETVLGIPFGDVVNAAFRPFSGLGNAQAGQTNWQ